MASSQTLSMMFLIVALSACMVAASAVKTSSRYKFHVCEPLNISFCDEFGSMTVTPNLLNYTKQEYAALELPLFKPLVDMQCSPHFKRFLCGVYAPTCDHAFELTLKPTPPCRTLCLRAKEGCEPYLIRYGILWPKKFDCNDFPDDISNPNAQCVGSLVPPDSSKYLMLLKLSGHHGSYSKDVTPGKQTLAPTTTATPEPFRPEHFEKGIGKELKGEEKPKTKSLQAKKLQDSPKKPTVKKAFQDSNKSKILPRRFDIKDLGDPRQFQGWVDVQGQGAANDYCRVLGRGRKRVLTCALAGSTGEDDFYTSMEGFNTGWRNTWFMRDMNGDGRDDYCRCVGSRARSWVACMEAGQLGFSSSPYYPGSQFTFSVPNSEGCIGSRVNPFFGY